MTPKTKDKVGIVVIGRNEGPRLARCFDSLPPGVPVVYVDSHSIDGSVGLATAHGAIVLRMPEGTTNAGLARRLGFRLLKETTAPELVQFVDGDSALAPDWIAQGVAELDRDPELAACAGRVREISRETLVQRWLDAEWRKLDGTDTFGGNVLIRTAELDRVGGWAGDRLAGEERALAERLRAGGKHFRFLDVPMATHDCGDPTWRGWAARMRRTGRAEAQNGGFTSARLSRWLWTIFFPALPLLFVRVYTRERHQGKNAREAREYALACCLAKPWETVGELSAKRRAPSLRTNPPRKIAANPPGAGFLALLREDFAQNSFTAGFLALALHRFNAWRAEIDGRARRAPFTAFYRAVHFLTSRAGLPQLPAKEPIPRRARVRDDGTVEREPRRTVNPRPAGALPRFDVYCVVRNEERILPHFLHHYAFASRIVLFDNHSSDNTRAIAESFHNVEVRPFGRPGRCSERELTKLRNTCWHESRGRADWVAIVDVDEFLYHRRFPDLRQYLRRCEEAGVTIAVPTGLQMISDRFPDRATSLLHEVQRGVKSDTLGSFDKWCLFRPEHLLTMNFSPGSHRASPRGEAVLDEDPDFLLLHYAHLGWDYVKRRWHERRQRFDRAPWKGGSFQYGWEESVMHEYYRALDLAAEPVLEKCPPSPAP